MDSLDEMSELSSAIRYGHQFTGASTAAFVVFALHYLLRQVGEVPLGSKTVAPVSGHK